MSTDPSLPLDDAHLKIDTGVVAYVRGMNLWGNSGKFDVIVPYSHLSGTALVAGQPRERDISGLGDPRFRLSVNFYGAPALTLPEYPAYKPDLVVGASVQVTPPWGQYDPSRAVNLGTNRWSIKPDIGFSKAFAPFTIDLTAGVTLFTRNDDYFGGQSLDQAPIYSTQANLSYDFGRGIWASFGATFYRGGRTTVNDASQGRRAEQFAHGIDGRRADRPLLLDQVQRQQRHQHAYRHELRHRRPGAAIPLGCGTLAKKRWPNDRPLNRRRAPRARSTPAPGQRARRRR